MERIVLGNCLTGKSVTNKPWLDNLNSYVEVFDAMALISLIAVKTFRKDKQCDFAQHVANEAEKLERKLIESGQWELQMKNIGARTSLEIRDYAERLVRAEFKE